MIVGLSLCARYLLSTVGLLLEMGAHGTRVFGIARSGTAPELAWTTGRAGAATAGSAPETGSDD